MATKDDLKEVFVTGAIPTEEDFHNLIDVAGEKGPKGDKGAKGDKGEQGPQGDPGADGKDGADGFPSESDWNDLVARVEALEEE